MPPVELTVIAPEPVLVATMPAKVIPLPGAPIWPAWLTVI